MKHKKLLLLFALFCSFSLWAADYEVTSPNEKFKIKLHINNGTQYEIWAGETQLISPSIIGLNLGNGMVIGEGTIKDVERNSVNDVIEVLIGKNKTLDEVYNELIIHFNENYDLVVRAYDEGIAYRFITALDGDIIINNEDFIFNFVDNPTVFFPEANNLEHWEKRYTVLPVNDIKNNRYGITPILYSYKDTPYKLAITESDVYDYPGLYVQENGTNSMKGMWAKYPKTLTKPDDFYDNHQPLTRYDYIANTAGTRTFPWRVFAISDNDKDLLNNELVYMLAEPNRLTDTDWIEPGKTTWEWWHKAMLTPTGAADPANGIPVSGNANLTMNLFRYYIDFAAANNIKYLTLDAHDAKYNINQLCAYAKGKGVKVMTWTWASCVVDPGRENWMAEQKAKGISGLKIDFFNRNDQLAMRWAYQMAEKAAELGMVLNYHGCPVPTGLNRTFPNILNFEAVLGNEENFWRRGSDPDYHVAYPYIRSLVGPADFTPGSFRNKTKNQFTPVDKPNTVPSSQGTRAHEMSMYVIFDHWLAYLCDAPTEYEKFPDLLDILSTIPTVWDKTVPVDGVVGEYIVMAKQTGNDWYVGGMTNWSERDVDVKFDFLAPGKNYKATIILDGNNAGNYPTRYTSEETTITADTELAIHMEEGGGFIIRLVEDGTVGIKDIEKKATVSIKTDNSQNRLYIEAKEEICSAEIYNVSGQLVLNEQINNSHSHTINTSSFSKGMYTLKVQTKDAISTIKFIY